MEGFTKMNTAQQVQEAARTKKPCILCSSKRIAYVGVYAPFKGNPKEVVYTICAECWHIPQAQMIEMIERAIIGDSGR